MTVSTRNGLFDVQTPPNTPIASPLSTTIAIGDSFLISGSIRIPSGHAGTTGIQVVFNGTVIIPWENSALWLVGDDDKIEFDVGTETDSQLVVKTYNLDVWTHIHYCRFTYTPMTLMSGASAPAQIVPVTSF